jgi:DNA-binding IscR family transcriptional regulator
LIEGVEWGAHCVVYLANLPEGAALSAGRPAEQHGAPRPYLAKTLQVRRPDRLASGPTRRLLSRLSA